MRLAAIYIKWHEYLFNKPQTINLGGQYTYSFEEENNSVVISRNLNNHFISDFFNLTDAKSRITNLNAIVGQNGAGKSTILDLIRSHFVKHKSAMPEMSSLLLFETDDEGRPAVLENSFVDIKLLTLDQQSTSEKLAVLGENVQTIYYSPHYDYTFNSDFDSVDDYDISFDKIAEGDLKQLGSRDSKMSGFSYSPSQELKFKNSLRQLEFLGSNLVEAQNIFKSLFDLPAHYSANFHIRGYKKETTLDDIPLQLRGILEQIDTKIEEEKKEWHQYADSGANKIQRLQYTLKRRILESMLSLLYRQMNWHHDFLEEGEFPYDELKDELEKADAYHLLVLFGKHGKIKLGENRQPIFSNETVESLLKKLYDIIDNVDDVNSIDQDQLKVDVEDAKEVLRLQKKFLNELNDYYSKSYEKGHYKSTETIEGFINYEPFGRKLSSGEMSLLNFFSRIYDLLNGNSAEQKDHYILLLDEADLTFHLSWKKRFVKAILKTIPYFFNELGNKLTVEIIITTHSPITLSDLPNRNVIYVERPNYDSPSEILDYEYSRRPPRTFGANISELIADSFFIEDTLIGDFASDKIKETIAWLNDHKNNENSDYHRKVVHLIDEPIVQRKLSEMYDEKMQVNLQSEIIDEQIKKLQQLKDRLHDQ